MTRPLRLQFPDALYHVTSRGDQQRGIYSDDIDRMRWIEFLDKTCQRHNFIIYSFCQMTNHFHMLVETPDANLSRGMQDLNGAYTQYFNRRHQVVGHLFQGRYKAILVQKQTYLLALIRYIALNPVRAGIVKSAERWPWSSHSLLLNRQRYPAWLACDWLVRQFGSSPAALSAYAAFINAGSFLPSPLKNTRHQLMLGDDGFVSSHAGHRTHGKPEGVSRAQRRALALPLADYLVRCGDQKQAMRDAYWSTAYTMSEIAAHFGVSSKTVSRAVANRDNEPAQASSCTNVGSDPGVAALGVGSRD